MQNDTKSNKTYKKLRLILGDQLNENHSWFQTIDSDVLYVMMEIKPESAYVVHHIQKITGIFAAMRQFQHKMSKKGHDFYYFKICEKENKHSFIDNLSDLIQTHEIQLFEYQLPDEFRLQELVQNETKNWDIPVNCVSTEHFIVSPEEFDQFHRNKKDYLMEFFYRFVRKKTGLLMQGSQPIGGKWNFDSDNRKKLPASYLKDVFAIQTTDVSAIYNEIQAAELPFIGEINPQAFSWPTNREAALEQFNYFIENQLPFFGTYQDAMTEKDPFIFHSRLSFALNCKLIHPLEVCRKVENAYFENPDKYALNQVEGFIRQIIGWREYVRGIYQAKMPAYKQLNFFENKRSLPSWFWNGNTHMNCMHHAIKQSLEHGYAHHIQRLMVTGNFALIAGINPDEVDAWYLGIYIDAFEWVEITNTRGMSQFADGGIVGTKPYAGSAAYVHKMSDYCKNCTYDYKDKTGEKACPLNVLYWHFYERNQDKLRGNQRISMMYSIWDKMQAEQKAAILERANHYLETIEQL